MKKTIFNRTKRFIGLKLYYDLLDEIFNNIGKSLSDLL